MTDCRRATLFQATCPCGPAPLARLQKEETKRAGALRHGGCSRQLSISPEAMMLDAAELEEISGPSTFNIVTIAVWEDQEAVDKAGEQVRAYYQRIGFDMPAMLSRLGVTAAVGNYQTPAALQ